MLEVKIDDKEVRTLMKAFPKRANRAAERTLDKMVDEIKDSVWSQLPKFFDRPTPYTLNSLKVTKTQRHNMVAYVWFKKPPRMRQHYLVSQVEGGGRSFKGLELAMGNKFFAPAKPGNITGRGPQLDKYGNITGGQIRQIMSVLKVAERSAGYSANITARSAKRNRKPRDYVLLRTRHGKLPPGIYQRYQTDVGPGRKTKKRLPPGEKQKSAFKGGFIQAAGLAHVMYQVKQPTYKKRLPFYQIGTKIAQARFKPIFKVEWDRQR